MTAVGFNTCKEVGVFTYTQVQSILASSTTDWSAIEDQPEWAA